MRGGSEILARNNFMGRANPSHIFAGQARSGPMRGGLARFAIPIYRHGWVANNNHFIALIKKRINILI